MDKTIKIMIETVSQEPSFNNEEIKIVKYFYFDKTILDLFNPTGLLNKIILEEGIDSDTITKIVFDEAKHRFLNKEVKIC